MVTKVSFKELFTIPSGPRTEFVATEEGLSFADETGYHIYGEIRLALSLSASEDTANAQKFLEVIQAYVVAANACALAVGAEILEVQGERIHILLPGGSTNVNTHKALTFCSNLTQILYDRIAPLAGKDWQGFATAADQGRAILIKTGNHSNGSVISLGSPANRPAKKLNRGGTRAGYLSIPTKLLNLVDATDDTAEWQEINMLETPSYIRGTIQINEKRKLQEATAEAFRIQALGSTKVRYADKSILKEVLKKGVSAGLKVQGLYFRADLDGFTKEVEAAFVDEGALQRFVERFVSLMGYADQFVSKLNRQVITLPWAGDCANMILLKNAEETYGTMKADSAPLVASEWHDQRRGFNVQEKTWKELMGNAEWVVAIAAGDSDEGSNGHLLVAPIIASNRTFLIAAGWGARRSLDAQSVDSARGRDTIIPAVDYKALDSVYRKLFEPITSIFYRASNLSKQKVQDMAINASQENREEVPRINVITPKPKPYYL